MHVEDRQERLGPTQVPYIDGGRGRAERDYSATELTVSEGDVVEALEEEGGWVSCRAADGRTGWIPESVVEPE